MSFGLYLHYPFCRHRCSYCNFYKEPYDRALERQYFLMLKNETQLMAQRYGRNGNMISTIFIGGGTPSLIDPELFTDWFNCLKDSFELSSDPEFSIECNPDSVSLELLTAFKELGVNRPVFGIQSFDAGLLKLLDRKHLRRDSYRAVYQTNVLGYHNFGVDLIFGLPGQTSGMLSSDIDELLELNPPHISYYQLTVEAETKLAQLVTMGKLRMPSDELIAAMYRGGAAKLVEAGYIRYEIC
ncbi:MAG: radical SAM protein, partial [candidate division Zixibacteria bacterium]|nr:radical SAM protein [candidate division Zixibacteria bacterium]